MCYCVQDLLRNVIGAVMYGRRELLVTIFFFFRFYFVLHSCIIEMILMHSVAYIIAL